MDKVRILFEILLRKILVHLTSVHRNLLKANEHQSQAYTPLSPTEDAENSEEYINALKWAFDNKKKIRNIAITGPYGSGKSSVIQTFQNKFRLDSQYKFLNISLATFKDEKEENSKNDEEGRSETLIEKGADESGSDILRLIELSILQQVFYHESDAAIPDSRFTRIEKRNKIKIAVSTVALVMAGICYTYVFSTDIFEKFAVFKLTGVSADSAKKAAVVFMFGIFSYVAFRMLNSIKGIVVKKIALNSSEIEIDEGISKSILNRHLDEILYFFEVTDYNIVVIEDLDRFEQTEVFTKLRELNLLLNNSKKVNKNIIFVYAIRDEMFRNKDRAKFFDFIIPIIPVINSSNSNEKILKIIEKNKYDIKSSLVDDISMFVDDMRLLYNVMNEYHIYSQKIDSRLNQDKLLSMIVYKNMYPEDFSFLSKNEGTLFGAIREKSSYLKMEAEILDKEITREKVRLKEIEEVKLKDVRELRSLYILHLISKIKEKHNLAFYAFAIQGNVCLNQNLLADDKFEYLRKPSNPIQFFYNNGGNLYTGNFNFAEVEKSVDSHYSYEERELMIIDANAKAVDARRVRIQELEKSKSELKKQRIKDLVGENKLHLFLGAIKDSKQKDLLYILLRKGYIDEDYLDYISIFYEGSLTKSDFDFLVSLKSQRVLDFDFRLDKIEALISKIDIYEFDRQFVLNFSLVEHLLKTEHLAEARERVFKQLSNGKEISVKFIDDFLTYTDGTPKFIKLLSMNWHGIWRYVVEVSQYSGDKRYDYFGKIVLYADVADIGRIFAFDHDAFSRYENFLLLPISVQRTKDILRTLELRLTRISPTVSIEILEYIYGHGHYSINVDNIHLILEKLGAKMHLFGTANYSCIKESSLQRLVDYIDENINEYIEFVYLKIELNREEPEDRLVELINSSEVNPANKENILAHTNTVISSIEEVIEIELLNLAFKYSRVESSWKNVIYGFVQNENKFSSEMIVYLNVAANYSALAAIRIETGPDEESVRQTFVRTLLQNDGIHLESYKALLKSVPYVYSMLDLSGLSGEKVLCLLGRKILKVTNANYQHLKENFSDLRTALVETNEVTFLNELGDFVFDCEDVKALLSSKILSPSTMEKLVNLYDFDFFSNDQEIVDIVSTLSLKGKLVNIKPEMLRKFIIKSRLANKEKIKLFLKHQGIFENDHVDEFLLSMPEPYSIVAQKGKKPKLDKTQENIELVGVLKEKEYISSFKIGLVLPQIQVECFRN